MKAKWISLPDLPKTEIPSPALTPLIPEKGPRVPEPPISTLRGLTKISNNQKEIIFQLENHNMILKERIDFLLKEVAENQEKINTLLKRNASFSCMTEEQESMPKVQTKYMETEALLGQISEDTAEEFLRNNPMILESLLNVGYFDRLADIITHLPKKARNNFIRYSVSQLHRFSLIISAFNVLIKNRDNIEFKNILQKCVSTIFNSEQSFVFLRSILTGVLYCSLPEQLEIQIKDEKCIIASTKSTKIYSKPSKEKNYSKEIDKLFNPKNSPCIVVPFSNIGCVMAMHTNKAMVTFKNEDISVGDIFTELAEPLIRENQATELVSDRIDKKKMIDDFEHELLSKDYLETLLPFITTKMKALINAEETRIYFLSNGKYILPRMKNGKITEEKIERKGIVKYIESSKKYLLERQLFGSNCDDELDAWCLGKSFCGIPIDSSEGECIAVLCASAFRNNIFTDEDLEVIMIISSGFALAVQRAFENKEYEKRSVILKDLQKVPEIISGSQFKHDEIFKELYTILNVDSMSIYGQKEGEEVKLIQAFGKSVFPMDFVKNRMQKAELINKKNVSELEDLVPVENYEYKSLFAAFDERDGFRLGIFCTNPFNITNRLHKMHADIIKCFTNIYFNSLDLEVETNNGKLAQNRYENLQKIIDISRSASNDLDIFHLLKTLVGFIHFDQSIVYIYDISAGELVPTDEMFPKISKEDPLFKELMENKGVFVFNKIEESELTKITVESVVVGINVTNDTYIVLFGKELGDAIYTLNSFIPVIKSILNYFRITDKEAKEVIKSNSYCNLPEITDPFDIHLCIESLTMSEALSVGMNILKHFNVEDSVTRKIISKASNMSKGSWTKCIECLQFAGCLLNIGKSVFSQSMEQAILIASLFWVLTDENDATSAQIAYGENAENKVRLFRAANVCRESGVDMSDNTFWRGLFVCYESEVDDKINEIEDFNLENERCVMLLGALLCQLCEFRRYFIHQSGAEITEKDVMTKSVLEMIITPTFSKVTKYIPALECFKENLEITRKDLENQPEEEKQE